MVEVIEGNTGEIFEAETLAEAASELIERPPLWRKHYQEEANVGPEFLADLLKAQIEMGGAIEADSSNEFNSSRYTSLGYLLAKIKPILNKYNFVVSYGVHRMVVRNDTTLPVKAFLPVYIRLVHAPTGQFERFQFEVPMVKFDAQSYGALLTYGRRYATEAYLGLKGGVDEDGVLASRDLTPEDKQKMLYSMLKKIEDCKTPLDLRTWYKASEQQVALLGDAEAEKLRTAYQSKLEATKDAIKKKSEAKNA